MTPFILSLMLAVAGRSAPQATTPDFAQAWQKASSAIERSYYARDTRKDEMEAHLKQYGPLASKATTKEQFRQVVDQMIADFKDSHFDMLTDEDQGYYLMDGLSRRTGAAEMPEFGAWFKPTREGYVVQMVLNGGSAEKAGIQKGDLVTAVDGQPFSPVSGLKADIGKTVTVKVDRGGQQLEKQVSVDSKPALQMFLDATHDSERIIEDHGKKIGYIHLWTQANDDFKNALSAAVYGKLQNTDAFILDLRDGFGGRPEGYGDPFFRPDVQLDWKFSSKGGMHQLFGYGRPLVVLINGGSRSAKEVLSYIFKKSHRATLIGSTTAGNVLGTSPTRLNDWAYIEIPIVDVFTDGVRLEGKGVNPDIAVKSETDGAGNDLYIQRALEFLADKK